MTNLSIDNESPALRLARYLKEFVGIRSTTVRDFAKYESVLWLSSMPQDADCWSPAWADEYDPESPWLEVRKQKFDAIPAPPESITQWVNERALKRATLELPPLLSVVFLPDQGAEVDEGEEPPLREFHLSDFPEVTKAYERYRPRWESWSQEHRRRQAIQKIYAELFSLHTQVLKQGEIVELVLGLGLLDWKAELNKKVIPIRRHVIVARVELEFDSAKGVIRVSAPGEGAQLQIEDDMLEAELRPDRTHYSAFGGQLEEIGDAIWDKAQMHTALQYWAGALNANSIWSDQLGIAPAVGNAPTVSFAPALILRKRSQTGMVRVYNELIDQLSNESGEAPDGWSRLIEDVDDYEDETPGDRDSGQQSPLPAETEVYFPLPANKEQRRIVEAINRQRGVLVQGPPGTGKSHTIANLMCHLLATGKRVLITAETGRALQVLKEKLPLSIQPLCVSLLGQGGDAFSELNAAVQGITAKQAVYSPRAHEERIQELDGELDRSRRKLAEIDSELRSLREDEACPHSIGHGSYHGTASAIAERVAKESEQFCWLVVSVDASVESPLSNKEIVEWLAILRRYSGDQVLAAAKRIPSSASLPSPASFAEAVSAETDASVAVQSLEQQRGNLAFSAVCSQAPNYLDGLQKSLQSLEEQRLSLGRIDGEWLQSAIGDSLSGRPARWAALHELCQSRQRLVDHALSGIDENTVTIPEGYDLRQVRSDAAAALSFLKSGGKWKRFGLLTPKALKDLTYFREEIFVNGECAENCKSLQVVCDYLDLSLAFTELHQAWEDVGAKVSASPWRLRAALFVEQLSVLLKALEYAESCQSVARALDTATPPIPQPQWMNGGSQQLLALIEAAAVEGSLATATETVDSCRKALDPLASLHDAHPIVREIATAVQERDIKAYSEGHASLVEIEVSREDQAERKRVEAILTEAVPDLVESVSGQLGEDLWNARLAGWESAWAWAIADAWLEKRSDIGYQRKLWKQRESVDKKISDFLAESASLRAWVHFFKRLSAKESAALKSWREAVRAMGKGTGKSAKMARLRREARQYMDACRDAIPVWIMPRYLVAEMVDPSPNRYDIIIVDEASQLGVDSLFLFYLAEKMVVVGDDQQISPYGVGVADAQIAGLQQHFLEGIPHQHALSAQSSLYGNAKIRFSQNLVLREHFRCMPEIIQFSNDLCYASNGTPLDPLRAYPANRLQPLVLRHVADGYREGTSQNAQNEPEADAIVAQILACIEDPRYEGATMGVISLQGESQAKLIERKLLGVLDPAVIAERRLICGDAYAFQGDERKVIFLSMVAAVGEKRIGALSNESARQRFNVAVSRAQDQLWLFHTAQLDVLSDKCMRYRLLSYMLDPTREKSEEAEQRFDSNFERAVFRRITDKGFHVRTQVCVGDPTNHRYRIDLVVEGMQGRLAVECDGDEWHGPDRYESDMARQRDLERAGWQFVRIRGSAFYRNPEHAMEPLWEELDRLGIRPGGVDEEASAPPAPIVNESPDLSIDIPIQGEVQPLAPIEIGLSSPVETTQSVAQSENLYHAVPVELAVPEIVERTKEASEPASNPKPIARDKYHAYEGKSASDPRTAETWQVAEGLLRIIKVEGPMLAKRAYDVYLRSCGIRRMGGELKRAMNRALQHAINKGHVFKEDESDSGGLVYTIVRPKSCAPVVLRDRGPRSFEEIPLSELQLVARSIAQKEQYQVGSDAHLRAILDSFELKRLTVQAGTRMLEALDSEFAYVDELVGGSEIR